MTGDVVVRIDGLHKSFGHLEVVRGVDLEVHRGEVVVIFGRSGSGKSTVLRCVNFIEDPTEGSIEVSGIRLAGRAPHPAQARAGPPAAAARGHGVPAVQPVPEHDRARQRHLRRPVRQARHRRRDHPARQGPPRPGRPRRQVGRAPHPALRRPAAARRHRPGPVHGARRDALRRAHLGARPGAHRRGAVGDEDAVHRAAHDDDGGDPRDGVRPRGGRPDGVLPRGPDPRAGPARAS